MMFYLALLLFITCVALAIVVFITAIQEYRKRRGIFKNIRKTRKEGEIKRVLCCPNCHIRFSDWFTWGEYGRYCYPCYHKGFIGPKRVDRHGRITHISTEEMGVERDVIIYNGREI